MISISKSWSDCSLTFSQLTAVAHHEGKDDIPKLTIGMFFDAIVRIGTMIMPHLDVEEAATKVVCAAIRLNDQQ